LPAILRLAFFEEVGCTGGEQFLPPGFTHNKEIGFVMIG